jgi:hypothetical protein
VVRSIIVQRELRVFSSFDDAGRADVEYYAALTPDERLAILLEIIANHREATGETSERLERVYRVTQLSET